MLSRLTGPRRDAARCLAFVLALGLAGQSASAQVNEADRLQRCVNNREALAPILAELALTYDDQQIAQARQVLRVISQLGNALRVAIEEHRPERVREYLGRIQEAGRAVAVICNVLDAGCPGRMANVIQQRIDESVAMRPWRQTLTRRYAEHVNNLTALRCDQAANTTFTIAGTWTGSNGLTYELSQSGNTVGWRVNSIAETGTVNVSGRSVAASWDGNWGSGSARGTVSVGPGGIANRIVWDNGVVFSR